MVLRYALAIAIHETEVADPVRLLSDPGGVPGAAAGAGASPAHMLQQLQMKRMGNPYMRNFGRRFQY